MASLRKRSIWISRRVSPLLEKKDLKGPSTASNKLPEVGTHVLMKSYGVMISSRTSMILVYTRRSVGAQLCILFFMSMTSYSLGMTLRDRSRRMLGLTQSSYIEKACAGEAHWSAVKIILKYLKRNKDMFLIYGGGELILEGYNDASFQSDDDDAKSQSVSEAAKEVVWMKNYIQELGVVPSIAEPVVIFYDNNGPIAQAMESRFHHRSKHILRRYHLLREMVSRGDIRMDRVSSTENTTDPLTKPISRIAHTQHLDKMGLRSMGDWVYVKWEIVRIGDLAANEIGLHVIQSYKQLDQL
ncbi:UNVERIFIED_CONTAM: hypothetical protein Slati_0387400 [Sesamum latifolium]|uniref:Uncharacterized protein n=1 Tax=Sesamum latifolium TaxID=2727402 RepID=A0AAW2XTZ5_9LAMI